MADDTPTLRKLPPLSPTKKVPRTDKSKKETLSASESPRPLPTIASDNARKTRQLPSLAKEHTKIKDSEYKQIDSDTGAHIKARKRQKKKGPTTQSQQEDDADAESPQKEREAVIAEKRNSWTNDENEQPNTSLQDLGTEPIVKRKKQRKPKHVDESLESVFAAELAGISEDVLLGNEESETHIPNIPVSAGIIKSVPTSKLFVETDSGFKGEKKSAIPSKPAVDEKGDDTLEPELTKSTTLDVALSVHRIMLKGYLFIHGLTAGIALWHIVIVYVICDKNDNLLSLYTPLAQPVQCMFYLLIGLCTMSAMDRNDIGYHTRRFLVRAVTFQSGAPAVFLYLIALILSLSAVSYEDQITLWYYRREFVFTNIIVATNSTLDVNDARYIWEDNSKSLADSLNSSLYDGVRNVSRSQLSVRFGFMNFNDNMSVWRSLNAARGVAAILGWLIISITPKADFLSKNLKSEDNVIRKADMASSQA